jgi:hypothetical protein
MPCRKCPRLLAFSHAAFSHAISALALTLALSGIASVAHAQGGCVNGGSGGCTTAPEIAPGELTQATALLAGTGLWLRYRRGR